MITERGGMGSSDSGPDLNRDAAMAIAEYAPGAEVVAAGRIWRSAGIARRHAHSGGSESYVDRGWYRICKSCNHPQIGLERDQFETECSHCKQSARNMIRRYLEPIGFLTSYEEREGRDPGTSRMRTKMVDEARLITRAGPEHYSKSDILGIETFFAPAHRRADDNTGLVGQMFVVNRGPKTAGYLTCKRCEHAVPAEAQGQMTLKSAHKNPRTGDPCPEDTVSFPQDLAHRYSTDIRGLRLSHPLPITKDIKRDEVEKMQNSLLRTSAEAFRLAAAAMLETDPRDLRSSTEMSHDNVPLVILSDTTPGGAGYVRRLLETPRFSARTLLAKAIEILDCPRKEACSTSCNKCLNDYSNQQHWDSFDRHLASKWLKELSERFADRPAHVPDTSVPVVNFTSRSLAVHTTNDARIIVIGNYIWGAGKDQTTEEEAILSARSLRDWLEADAERQLTYIVPHSAAQVSHRDATTVDKTVADILLSARNAGQISFFKVPDSYIRNAPRITAFGSGANGTTISEWFATAETAPIFASASEGVEHRNQTTDPWLARVKDHIKSIPSPLEVQDQATKAYRFKASKQRDLSLIFETIPPKAYDVVLADPYIAVNRAKRTKLLNFIIELSKSGVSIKSLKLMWKPDESHESLDTQTAELQQLLKAHCEVVKFAPWNRGMGHFHDRRILLRGAGDADLIQLDVTSGIDNLMSFDRECAVFVEHPSG